MLERTVTSDTITVTGTIEADLTGVADGLTAKALRVDNEGGDLAIFGLALGMRITPCYPFPSGGTYKGYIVRTVDSVDFIYLVIDPVYDDARKAIKYRISIYEPSSLTPVDVLFAASLATTAAAMARLSGALVTFGADFTTTATALARTSGVVVNFGAAFITQATARARFTASREILLQASLETASSASANLSGFTVNFGATFTTTSTASASLTGSAVFFAAGFATAASGTMSLTGLAVELDMNLHDVVTELLNLWGIESICKAPDWAIDRAIGDVNSSMQIVWNQASERNYWSSSTLTLTLADGEDSVTLPNDIQNVVGPCRLGSTKRPLTPIGTIGELETFADIYLDGETASEPVAYHIERLNQTGNDPAKSIFRITPPVVGADVGFLLEVVKEAPRFTASQLSSRPILPIPHRYVESLLLPIARYRASSFWLFDNGDSKPTIDRDYQMAMEAIGAADPLPGKSGDNQEGASK